MSFHHADPDSFTAGTVGPPGQRVFYLQSRSGAEVVSLRLEKQQVRALAEYLAGLLADLPAVDGDVEAGPLVEPVIAEWTVGTIGVAYDNEIDRIIVVAEQLVVPDGDEEFDPDQLDAELDDDELELSDDSEQARFILTRAQVRSFIRQAESLMRGGRPPCRVCGLPIDPTGHACPRDN